MNGEEPVNDLKVSTYEHIRKQRIEENKRLLEELGLTSSIITGLPVDINALPARKKTKYSTKTGKIIQNVSSSRTSRRLKGEAPEDIEELEAILDQNDRMVQVARQNAVQQNEARQLGARAEVPLTGEVYAPLTLLSIGTTIWDLGELYTGPGRSRYWSGRGCRYKHPYPIGYHATKSHFGNNYTMRIIKGEDGPEFTVQVNASGTIFKGATPTGPWTDACKRSKSQGTRVSGPLFYGFSDPITMKMIENMDNYDRVSKPEEKEEMT